MKPSKKARLIAAGWKVGDAAEFLGLAPQEIALIEIRLALARELRRRRARKGLTQIEVAKLLRSSQSRVAKMEVADRSVSVDLLMRSLLALGATRVELGRLLAARAA
jgi:predicted XRE-type DNA-binding protein